MHLEAGGTGARAADAGRQQRDGRDTATQAHVHLLELHDELAPGRLCRRQIADDDVGDERGPQGIRGAGGGDDRARNSSTDRRKWRASWSSSITRT
jgi:hypothetical protein